MLVQTPTVHQDAVEVDEYESIQHVLELHCHSRLECGRGIRKAKRHNQAFEVPISHLKRGLVAVLLPDLELVISRSEVKLGEELGAAQPFEEVVDARKRADVLDATGGEAVQRPREVGGGGEIGHGEPDQPLGGRGGGIEGDVIIDDREARGTTREGFPGHEDQPEFDPLMGERIVDWQRRGGKGQQPPVQEPPGEGSSKRKEGGAVPATTQAGKRLRQENVDDVYGGEWVACHKKAFLRWLYSSGVSFNAFRNEAWRAYQQVLLQQPGSSPLAVLPSHSEIASMQAVEMHRAELAEELEEFMSLVLEWAQDLVQRVKEACAPLGSSIADRIIRRVQARSQHMLELAHFVGFLLNPRRRHVPYFSGEVQEYHAWLVRQAKRYILTQTGFDLEGAEYLLACRQFEDFHMQQGRFAERNWAVHEGIHTKKRNRLAFEKVVQLVEITANVRLTEYRRAGCGYVLPWQRGEGMLDCQAGLEVEPVRTGTRQGMTAAEIAEQVALITRDPIGSSAPPSADAVFERLACIFRPYPRDDDSDEEPAPEGSDDPALPIPIEIDETHEEANDAEVRTYTARWAADRAEEEMQGGDEDLWGPFGEVASTGDARADRGGASHADTSRAEAGRPTPAPTGREPAVQPPPAPGPAPPTPVSPLQPATTQAETEELASSLPPQGGLQRSTVVRQLRLRSPSPGVLQEEGDVAAAAQEAATVSTAREEVPAQATAEEEVAAARLQEAVPMDHDGVDTDEQLVRRFITEEVDAVVGGLTPGAAMELGISGPTGGAGSEMGTHFDFDLSMGPQPTCGGATSTDRAPSRNNAADATETQTPMERTQVESPDTARDIMERERARLMASSNPRAQAFARHLEETKRRETGGDGVQGGVVAGEDVMEGVAVEADDEAIRGGPEAVDVPVDRRPQAADEAVQAGQQRDEGAIDARPVVQETATDPVVPFSGLHLAQGRQSQPVQAAVHGVPPPVITDMGSEPVVVPPRLPSHFAPQEVRRPLDADELAREAVRDVTRLDRRIFDRRLDHPAWQAIPSVPWGPASPVWSGSTSTGGRTAGDFPGVSGGVQETAPHTRDMPPPPPRPPVGDPSSSPTGRGSRSPQTPGRSRIRDTTAVLRDVCDTSIFGRTDLDLDSTRRVTEHIARLQPGLGRTWRQDDRSEGGASIRL
ncbi:hypothetical protein CBR_g39659 [Chara braunii]|uniref:Uncharacterized protein n=1 Tax=Chara braunii TaxID=69332 RepID=A0A388K1F8_CHABU|nr:hypothetical protein CBR_g39659 [Chara braunii]|eukprot:GBG63878.1 hypothetical protein CBR_g39659 [Chara braunii]